MIYPWQTQQWQQLQAQIKQQRLAHGLLLTGQRGLGKQAFAESVAASLLCSNLATDGHACGECVACNLMQACTHPDLLTLAPEAEDKAIKVDDIRELASQLVLTSQLGGYKVALIALADNMNINAANSLLKTLEEPVKDTLLVLVSSRPHRLPITIRSRCQAIHFAAPPAALALPWLQQQSLANAEALLNLAHGSPLLAVQLGQQELLEQRKALISVLLGRGGSQSLLEAAASLSKWPLDHLLEWLYDWVCDLLRRQQAGSVALVNADYAGDIERLASSTSNQALYEFLDEVVQLKRVQSIPLNSQLLWEDLLISWERLIKRA